MEWLNLKTSVLHAPEFIGSKPAARATWLAVSLWCASQENSGRILGADAWGNRQWQQTCGVTRREIDAAPRLLTWDGADLLVWNYPVHKEAEVQFNRAHGRTGGGVVSEAKRIAARLNGAKGGRPPKTQETQNDETQETQEPKRNPSENPTEWKGIGKEEEGNARFGLPDSLNTPRFRERWIRWQMHWANTFNFGNPMPEMTAYQQLEDMVKIGEERAILALNNALANGKLKKPAEPFTFGQATRPAQPVRVGQNLTESE